MFFEIGVLKGFAIFTGKYLCWSLFLIVAGLKACDFLKKKLQYRCFPENIAKKNFKNSFFIEHLSKYPFLIAVKFFLIVLSITTSCKSSEHMLISITEQTT